MSDTQRNPHVSAKHHNGMDNTHTSVGGHSVEARHHFKVVNVSWLDISLHEFDNLWVAATGGR